MEAQEGSSNNHITPTLKTSAIAIKKMVGHPQWLTDALKSRLLRTFTTFSRLIEQEPTLFKEHQYQRVKTFAPIEMVAVTVLIAQYGETRSDELLRGDIKLLRETIRLENRDLRLNTITWRSVWNFIDNLESIRGAVDGSTLAKTKKPSKRKQPAQEQPTNEPESEQASRTTAVQSGRSRDKDLPEAGEDSNASSDIPDDPRNDAPILFADAQQASAVAARPSRRNRPSVATRGNSNTRNLKLKVFNHPAAATSTSSSAQQSRPGGAGSRRIAYNIPNRRREDRDDSDDDYSASNDDEDDESSSVANTTPTNTRPTLNINRSPHFSVSSQLQAERTVPTASSRGQNPNTTRGSMPSSSTNASLTSRRSTTAGPITTRVAAAPTTTPAIAPASAITTGLRTGMDSMPASTTVPIANMVPISTSDSTPTVTSPSAAAVGASEAAGRPGTVQGGRRKRNRLDLGETSTASLGADLKKIKIQPPES